MNTINDKAISANYVSPPTKVTEVQEAKQNSKVSTVLDNQNNQVGKPISNDSQDNLVREVNSKMLEISDHLAFKKDNSSGRNVFSLIDSESNEIIKQFPSEEFLKISASLKEYVESKSLNGKDSMGSFLNEIV